MALHVEGMVYIELENLQSISYNLVYFQQSE